MKLFVTASAAIALLSSSLVGQTSSPIQDSRVQELIDMVSAERVEHDIRRLVGFGTRHTMSDTLSTTRGIGAARRWIYAEFERISQACGECLEVTYVSEVFDLFSRLPDSTKQRLRIPDSTNVVNVLAIQRGTSDPNRVLVMSGDIDSRISARTNYTDSAPGANDNASGVAGVIEAARVMSQRSYGATVVYAALSGEEQGLFGGRTVARNAAERGWNIEGVLNNDMIGNIEGVNGRIDNTTARVFSDGVPPTETDQERRRRRFTGGEVDGVSRQLARYVDHIADLYLPSLDVMMIYRLDRFGRGGHHRPFADLGFPAVRIMETNENYTRQHQDIRNEDGIAYGDVIAGVNFEYAAKLTSLNIAALASLAWAPAQPEAAIVCGAVQPHARMKWQPPEDTSNLAGYRVYWRLTDSPTWDFSRWVGNQTVHTFDGLVIDNFFFGVASVSGDGSESTVAFPGAGSRSACAN
ncbi:MAG: M28 family metallopeptidase [Gemmatimonadetes bacterium]|nr:M28 family metallopeptidase [Gemmatimonadota bacterium]